MGPVPRKVCSLRTAIFGVLVWIAAGCAEPPPTSEPPSTNWTYHGGDFANTRYAPLSQIDAKNVGDLKIAWRWTSIETDVMAKNPDIHSGTFKATPLVVDGVMYLPTSFCQIVALDAGTGELLWQFDPQSYEAGRPTGLGFQHRGLSYWTDGEDARVFLATHDLKLWACDAKTGKPCADFGEGGVVDLEHSLGRKINPRTITHASPVGICRNTVIVGSVIFDGGTLKEMTPGHVRGYNARTGELKWTFHTIPQSGEFGTDTWEDDAWKYSGNTNAWAIFSADEALNYVYVPTSAATNDMYGGHRLGDNLFAESIVCLDAETGERVWHYQVVHHGLWDYDLPAAPNLVDLEIDGVPRKILAQVSKQGFTYVLDRVTGEPIWPIMECDVPQSTVPGERSSPTQPIPTKPAPFERQGFTDDDIIDFTPALKAEALESLKGYARGPLYTPPSESGTLGLPGPGGGAYWAGAALDPETSILYIPSFTTLSVFKILKPDPNRSNLRYTGDWLALSTASTIQGLPITKPPYARITAIDLHTGEHVWMTPHGDGPINHPALAGLKTGPLGVFGSGRGPLVTKTLLFVTQGQSEYGTPADKKPKITVFDKKTGKILNRILLPADPLGNPITYLHQGKQYIAVAVGGGTVWNTRSGVLAEIVALSL